MALLPVDEALQRILAGASPTASESVDLIAAQRRVLAEDVAAATTQPPFNSSAMDGYAVASADLAAGRDTFRIVGESQAGHRFPGPLKAGETARILTGAPLPEGSDTVVIQENVERSDDAIRVREVPKAGANVRLSGSDFRQGQILITAGTCLDASAITLAAAAGHGRLSVRKRPRIAILATGDELVDPGTPRGPDQIVSSNPYGLAALVERAGAEAHLLGIAADTHEAIAAKLDGAKGTEVLVTIGGASVGDRDLVRPVLEASGMTLDFWKVGIRPGKPMLSGTLGAMRVLGLPGNPLSCLIAARVFLIPLIYALLGRQARELLETTAVLAQPLPANGARQHYIPGIVAHDSQGMARVTALPAQDSAKLTGLVGADALIVREPEAAAAPEGEAVRILPFDP